VIILLEESGTGVHASTHDCSEHVVARVIAATLHTDPRIMCSSEQVYVLAGFARLREHVKLNGSGDEMMARLSGLSFGVNTMNARSRRREAGVGRGVGWSWS